MFNPLTNIGFLVMLVRVRKDIVNGKPLKTIEAALSDKDRWARLS